MILCCLNRSIEDRYIEVLFHAICNFGRAEENLSLYRGRRYIEVRYSAKRLTVATRESF